MSLERTPRGSYDVEVCAGERCRVFESRGAARLKSVRVPLPAGTGDEVRVSVRVQRNDRTLARAAADLSVVEERPNGEGCPPVCRIARGAFNLALGSLLPA